MAGQVAGRPPPTRQDGGNHQPQRELAGRAFEDDGEHHTCIARAGATLCAHGPRMPDPPGHIAEDAKRKHLIEESGEEVFGKGA